MTDAIKGRRLIVTGAAGGIGAGAVKGLAPTGAKIAAVYNNTPPSDDLKPLATWYKCDLTDEKDVTKTFTKIASDLGGLDALVNVAGKWRSTPVGTIDAATITEVMANNFTSVVLTNQAAQILMKDKGGRIINFGSVEGLDGNVGSPIYASSKAAIHTWTRSAARAWGQFGITVNTVTPAMESPVYQGIRAKMNKAQLEQLDATLRERIPMGGRMGNAEQDCAPVLAFLISDASSFITGQIIPVDGGLSMMRG